MMFHRFTKLISKVGVQAVQKYGPLSIVAGAEEVHRSQPVEDGWKAAVHSLLEVADHNLVAAPAHSLAAAVHSHVGEVAARNLAADLAGHNPAAAEAGTAADRNYREHCIGQLKELRTGLVTVRCGHLLGAEHPSHPWYHKTNQWHLVAS